MRFNIDSLVGIRGASMNVEGTSNIQDINLGRSVVKYDGPIAFEGKITNAGDCMVAEGVIKGKMNLVCDRCLKDFEMDIALDFMQSYCTRTSRASSVIFDGEENLDFDHDEMVVYEGEVIDIFPDVEQAIILSIPIRILCKQDCKGLCEVCGADQNETECKCRYNN